MDFQCICCVVVVACAFGELSKKLVPNVRSQGVAAMLSSVSFTFRSVIRFEFIFVKGVRSEPRFII